MKEDIGLRLRLARRMSGMSLADASQALEHVVSRQCIHKYEKGRIKVNSLLLSRFSEIYKVPLNFFYRTPNEKIELQDVRITFNSNYF